MIDKCETLKSRYWSNVSTVTTVRTQANIFDYFIPKEREKVKQKIKKGYCKVFYVIHKHNKKSVAT